MKPSQLLTSSVHRLLSIATIATTHGLTHLVAGHSSEASTEHRIQVPTTDLAAEAAHELNDAAASTHQHKDSDNKRNQDATAAALSKGALAVSRQRQSRLAAR